MNRTGSIRNRNLAPVADKSCGTYFVFPPVFCGRRSAGHVDLADGLAGLGIPQAQRAILAGRENGFAVGAVTGIVGGVSMGCVGARVGRVVLRRCRHTEHRASLVDFKGDDGTFLFAARSPDLVKVDFLQVAILANLAQQISFALLLPRCRLSSKSERYQEALTRRRAMREMSSLHCLENGNRLRTIATYWAPSRNCRRRPRNGAAP